MLHRLWPAFEDIPGSQAALAEWRDRLGEDFAAIQTLLLPTDQFAASLPVADDPYASYRIVWHAPDDIVGVHDGGGPAVTLPKRDVLIYRLDHQQIIRHVVTALGFESAQASLDGVPHTYRIGSYRPFAGFAFPAFLTIPLESVDLQRAVEVISSRYDEPFIILAPTRDRLRPACESLLTRRKSCFLALSETIEADGSGKWNASAAAQQQLADFQQTHIPQATDGSAMEFFPTPANATWSDLRLKFIDGETVSIKVGSASGRFLYSQMGMTDGRNAKPTKQWELLRSFAQGHGAIDWSSRDAGRQNQKRRENLARDLKAFFCIDGEPIEYADETKGWRTVFAIEPDA